MVSCQVYVEHMSCNWFVSDVRLHAFASNFHPAMPFRFVGLDPSRLHIDDGFCVGYQRWNGLLCDADPFDLQALESQDKPQCALVTRQCSILKIGLATVLERYMLSWIRKTMLAWLDILSFDRYHISLDDCCVRVVLSALCRQHMRTRRPKGMLPG